MKYQDKLWRAKGGNMPEEVKKKKKKKVAPEAPAPNPVPETPVKKKEAKCKEVRVLCNKCKKYSDISICNGRYNVNLGNKTISGKAENKDLPCPFCNNRIAMPVV